MSRGAAAAAFSVFTVMTSPMALVISILASGLNNTLPLAVLVTAVAPVGYLGNIAMPELGVVGGSVAGITGGAFPLAITMFTKRTRTMAGSAALSGFAMGVGYLFGALGPPWVAS